MEWAHLLPDGPLPRLGPKPAPNPQPTGGAGPALPVTVSCPPPADAYDAVDEQFIKDYWGDAQRVAAATGLPAGFILAWASVESYNRASNALGLAATENNNFFGLTYSNANQQNLWANEVVCPDGSYKGRPGTGGHACFDANDAFFVSGMAALNKKYLSAALGAIEGGNTSYANIGQAIANAGFNGSPTYGAAIQSRWARLRQLMSCAP